MLSQFRRWLKEVRVDRMRRRGLVKKKDWGPALTDEMDFWENALTDPEKNWNIGEFRERTNPDLELQPELKRLIDAAEGAIVRILDVGAGPLTRVGRKWAGRDVQVTATDPLADRYRELLRCVNLKPPVVTIAADGEKLRTHFPENHFDLAYASNALDHSYDPLAAIGQMLAVTKPDHYVYLWHFANAGRHEYYAGLHQWNFDIIGNDFLLTDGQTKHSLAEKFRSIATVECETTRAFNSKVVIAKLKKYATP